MTTIVSNQKLYDVAAYNSILLESYKLYEFEKRLTLFRELKKELLVLFSSTEYSELSYLTKKEVNALIKKVKAINKAFSTSVSMDVETMFTKFTEHNLEKQRKVWASVILGKDEDTLTDAELESFSPSESESNSKLKLFLFGSGALLASKLLRDPITGVGRTLASTLSRYSALSDKRFEDLILKAWSSGYTKEQLVSLLVGDSSNRQGVNNGALKTMRDQLNAIIDTSIGFAAEETKLGLFEMAITKQYIWISVMDNATTIVCQSRNNKIFKVGEGPVPPAHFNCRSSIAPFIDGNGKIDEMNFKDWLDKQPKNIYNSIKNYGIIDPYTGKYKAITPVKPSEFF